MSTNSRIAFGVNAAQGISVQTARSWSERLPREPRLLVPVHLDVLVVRKTGGKWARCGIEAGPDGKSRQPPPFSDRDGSRPRGAYLLWAPPDALSRGLKPRDDADGPIHFPSLPDRWLVLRLSPSRRLAGRRTLRGWVLRADAENAPPTPLDQWVDTRHEQGDGVTVVGPGQLNWAGYFDNVENRFGFYDDLKDVAAGPVAYLVCGWFGDPDLDPLADPDIHTLKDFEKRLEDFGWNLPDHLFKEAQARALKNNDTMDRLGLQMRASDKTLMRASGPTDALFGPASVEKISTQGLKISVSNWWPRHSLYHGAVVGIGWPDIGWTESSKGLFGEEVGGPPPAGSVNVGIGNTLSEALAAVVAQRSGKLQHARLLQAFQLGAMRELDEPDGRAKLDALLHSTGFSSFPGGTVSERVYQPPVGEPPRDNTIVKPGAGVFSRYYRRTKGGAKPTRPALGAKGAKSTPARGKVDVRYETRSFPGKTLKAERTVNEGRLDRTLTRIGLGLGRPQYRPGRWVDRDRPLPRLYRPVDPAIVIEGIGRSYQHGGDGRFDPDGRLGVRITGAPIKDYRLGKFERTLNGEDILDRGVMNGSVPPECEDLLNELALLDPGSAGRIIGVGGKGRDLTTAQKRTATEDVIAHQTAWWATRDPRSDHSAIVSLAPFSGTLPSPVAINMPSRPWNPLHLEWRIEYIASPDGRLDWSFGEIDYNEIAPETPAPGVVMPITIEGRSPLSNGSGRTLAGAIRKTLDEALRSGGAGPVSTEAVNEFISDIAQTISKQFAAFQFVSAKDGDLGAQERAALGDVATALEEMDVLSGGFDGMHLRLRTDLDGDGVSKPDDGAVPANFHAFRAGFFRVLRLRVVDGYGQTLDLAGSTAAKAADPARLVRSEPLVVTGRPELLALPPRLTAPSRLWLRFTDAGGGPDEAHTETDQAPAVSPVCGYLMPNHLDAALLFFTADGTDVGVVRRDEDAAIIWEDAPGAPSTVGASPANAIDNAGLAAIASGLLDWGVADAGLDPTDDKNDTALHALMRTIDTTRWSTDPFGHQGEEHLSLLVGHPIVVLRAVVRLEVQEPVDPEAVNGLVFPVRLGALAHWQDGLLGYFVGDDYRTLHCAAAACAELARAFGQQQGFLQGIEQVEGYAANLNAPGATVPINHPYLDRSGVILVRPNEDVRLTLLLEPNTLVHATAGVLPRKEVGLRREWTEKALARLSPTFRFGPVLVDPKRIRMPVAAELHGTWSWDHRTDVTSWENLPVIHATQDALLPQDPPEGSEGWLRLRPVEDGQP